MLLSVVSLNPSFTSLLAIVSNLLAQILGHSYFEGDLLHREEARLGNFSMVLPSFAKEVAIDQT